MEYILISKHMKNKKTAETVSMDLARANCAWLIAALDDMICYRGEGEQ